MMAREHRPATTHVTCKLCRKRFRAITVFHLRAKHHFEGDHPILDYMAEFDLRFSMCGESRRKISEGKEEFWEERGQHRTPESVVAEIRRRHRAGKSLRGKQVPVWLYEISRRLFGGWPKAVAAAGLDYEQVTGVRRWTRDRVVGRIKELEAEGVPLDATSVEQQYPALHNAATKLFPRSWAKALLAAGLNPDDHKMPRCVWNRTSAEDWIRRRAAAKESILTRDVPRDLRHFVNKYMGTGWAEFVEAVTGAPYPGIKKRLDWTKDKVLAEIRRLKAEGQPLNSRAVAARGQAVIKQARKFFGSWDAARAAAGV